MIAITIENSTYCGADCITCVRKKMKNVNQNMSNEFFCRVIDDINRWNNGQLEALSFVGTGDPLMDPGFADKVRYVKENTGLKIHLTNTGHMMSEKIIDVICKYVDSVKISHYAVTAETYKKVHGGALNYYSVTENINALLERKDRPRVTMTFLMVEENAGEKDAWIDKWKRKCDFIDVWTPHNWGGNLRDSEGEGHTKSCKRPGRDFQIHVDGKVSVCCLDVCEDLVVGDLNYNSWQEVVGSQALNRIIELHKEGRYKECGICGDCDLLYDRKDALVYSSDKNMQVGQKAGFSLNSVDFSKE